MLNLNLDELNTLYYCLGKVLLSKKSKFVSDEELEVLSDKIWSEIENKSKVDEVEELIRGMGGLF